MASGACKHTPVTPLFPRDHGTDGERFEPLHLALRLFCRSASAQRTPCDDDGISSHTPPPHTHTHSLCAPPASGAGAASSEAASTGPPWSMASLAEGDWFDCRDRTGKWWPATVDVVTPTDLKASLRVRAWLTLGCCASRSAVAVTIEVAGPFSALAMPSLVRCVASQGPVARHPALLSAARLQGLPYRRACDCAWPPHHVCMFAADDAACSWVACCSRRTTL